MYALNAWLKRTPSITCSYTAHPLQLFERPSKTGGQTRQHSNQYYEMSMILYGVFNKTEHRYSLNYTLVIAKFSVYCSYLHDEKLSFDSFLILLKDKLKIQKEIKFKNNTLILLFKNPFNVLFKHALITCCFFLFLFK